VKYELAAPYSRMVARLDRKRLGQDTFTTNWNSIGGVFDEQTRRKPLVFAADAGRYGI
jgi:hypothetical protein